MKKVLSLFTTAGLIYLFILLYQSTSVYSVYTQGSNKPHILKNNCGKELPFQLTSSTVQTALGKKQFTNPQLGFVLTLPEKDWYSYENTILDIEEQILYPRVIYSLYASYPIDTGDPLRFKNGQEAYIKILVFESYCQPVDEWEKTNPEGKDFQRNDVTIDNVKGIKLTSEINGEYFTQLLFTRNLWHYQVHGYTKQDTLDKEKLGEILESFRFTDYETI